MAFGSSDKRRSHTFSPSSSITSISKRVMAEAGGASASSVQDAEFASKRWVWLPDSKRAFIKGFVVSEEDGDRLKVRCTDDSDRIVNASDVDNVNPPQFDRSNDMAELTFLNEASVVHNLATRYSTDEIYTYSGLFLVAVNPYKPLPIYDEQTIAAYKNKQREEVKPHIFAITDLAFRSMLETYESQSILVTGESGAGKTENTKKVIQYLAAITTEGQRGGDTKTSSAPNGQHSFEQQILQANPILESFGNAQTVRNNNSSRFGKFIRIEFSRSGQIAGASIDWYLLEKSRVVYQNSKERNYHIFYQLLHGASKEQRAQLLLEDQVDAYAYLKQSNKKIASVDDSVEFRNLQSSFKIMGISNSEQNDILRVVSSILNIGNIEIGAESADQGRILNVGQVEKVSHLLGINCEQFTRGLLRPRVKAGREWVHQSRSADQVRHSLDALAKGLYERLFSYIVNRINQTLERSSDNTTFIGVLDIAGFEIFDTNSFEQLCINYTNEKLQQFFNHHMFVLEQEEYTRENIEWEFIDFGRDLQPTIDLIEKPNPMGIFSCLDEDSVMPRTTDKSFTDKLTQLWDKKSDKFKKTRISQGFILTHYAAEVEYSTEGWLEKNKDPMNDNVTNLLVESSDRLICHLFSDDMSMPADDNDKPSTPKRRGGGTRVKKGIFRTVAQRHKEQLSHLMTTLHATHPHFVRCIIPNHEKRPGAFDNILVLDQLRCNGVLEGIRIARSGFPNRLPFSEFRQRYEVLVSGMPRGYLEGQKASSLILRKLGLDDSLYKVGLTKVFFKSGVLAQLEEQREAMVRDVITRVQCVIRGHIVRKKVQKALFKTQATAIVRRNLDIYMKIKDDPWWKLYVKMRPLLIASQDSNKSKALDREYQKLKGEVKAVEKQKKDIEEERRKAIQDVQRLTKELEGERMLALDKDEILKRAKACEADLEEQLNVALDDLDKLEAQCDELLRAKKKVEEHTETLKTELENGAKIIAVLEKEKSSLEQKASELETKLTALESDQSTNDEEFSKLDTERTLLKQKLDEKEAKVSQLESMLKEAASLLETKLREAAKKHEASAKRLDDLEQENVDLRGQLNDLTSTSADYEEIVRKKEAELKTALEDVTKHKRDLSSLQEERDSLHAKHSSLHYELSQHKKEVDELRQRHSSLEKDAAESKQLLQERILEHDKLGQTRKLLDKELADLQNEVARLNKFRDEERRASEAQLQEKNSLLEKLRSEKSALDTKLKNAFSATERDDLMRQLTLERAKSSEVKKIRMELSSLKLKLKSLEKERAEAVASLEQVQAQTGDAKKRAFELQKEREALTLQVSELKKTSETQAQELERIRNEKSQLVKETNDMRRQFSESSSRQSKLESELQQKTQQMERDKAARIAESEAKIAKLTAERDSLARQESKLRKDLDSVRGEQERLALQQKKLRQDLEDKSHDVSREQRARMSAERMAKSLEEQVAALKSGGSEYRRLKSESETEKRKLAGQLEEAKKEAEEKAAQLATLRRVINKTAPNGDGGEVFDLAKRLEESDRARRKAEDDRALLQAQLEDAKKRWMQDLEQKDSKYFATKRQLLEGLQSISSTSPSKRPLSVSVDNSRSLPGAADSAKLDRASMIEKENVAQKVPISQRSRSELEDMIESLQSSKADLLAVYHDTSSNLVKTKELLAEANQDKARLERELRGRGSNDVVPESEDLSEMQLHLEAERARNDDLADSLNLYKSRAEEYYGRLESAETIVLKATRAEAFAKTRMKEMEETLNSAIEERRQADSALVEAQNRLRKLEGELEDKKFALSYSQQSESRLAKELRELNDRWSKEIEQANESVKAMRNRYVEELKSLSVELEMQKQTASELLEEKNKLSLQLGNGATSSSSWNAEKRRLEAQIAELSKSSDETNVAYQESQRRIGSLLSQVRTLRTTMNEITSDRDQLQKDKRTLEKRLAEVSENFEQLAMDTRSRSLATSQSSNSDHVDDLNASIQRERQVASSALKELDSIRKAFDKEKKALEDLRKTNAQQAKANKEQQLRILELETQLLGPAKNGDKLLRSRVAELEERLHRQANEHTREILALKADSRSLKDLESQLESKERLISRLQEESAKGNDRIKQLIQTVDALQAEESAHRIATRRADREARDAKERALRLEKELGDWKDRVERFGSQRRSRDLSFV